MLTLLDCWTYPEGRDNTVQTLSSAKSKFEDDVKRQSLDGACSLSPESVRPNFCVRSERPAVKGQKGKDPISTLHVPISCLSFKGWPCRPHTQDRSQMTRIFKKFFATQCTPPSKVASRSSPYLTLY